MSNSEEEEIARNYICFGNPDVTILVLDATCLERNLNLVYQTMEITPNIIVCINLLDEAKSKGININLEKLEELLGVPVVGTIARKKKTLSNLMKKIYDICSSKNTVSPNLIKYSNIIENNINILSPKIDNFLSKKYKNLSRWICLKLFDNDEKIISSINNNIFKFDIREKKSISKTLNLCFKNMQDAEITSNNFKDEIISSILENCEQTHKQVCTYSRQDYNKKDRKIDKILTSKTFGIPIMLRFFCLIFWFIIIWVNFPSKFL